MIGSCEWGVLRAASDFSWYLRSLSESEQINQTTWARENLLIKPETLLSCTKKQVEVLPRSD